MLGGLALKNITTFSINLKDHHSKTTALNFFELNAQNRPHSHYRGCNTLKNKTCINVHYPYMKFLKPTYFKLFPSAMLPVTTFLLH
jgi:hypothetical protein